MASVAFDPSQITAPERVVDVHGLYAKYLIQDHVDEKRRSASGPLPLPLPFPLSLPQIESISTKVESDIGTVGILGAGVGGLYAAMILDSLGIPFEILEASGRTGGRVYTHEFSKKEHDYYDVGAMRFPDEPAMSRLFHLFRCHQLNSDGLSVNSKLIKYYYGSENDNSFLSFNGVSVRKSQHKKDFATDVFQFSKTGVPPADLKKGSDKIIEDTFDKYVKALKKDLEPMSLGQKEPSRDGWKQLMKQDKHSVRSYMALEKHISLPTIRWCETMDNSTDSYDKAFSEACLDIVAFGDDNTKWHCLDGGSQVLPNSMEAFIRKRRPNSILLNKEVTGLRTAGDLQGGVEVYVNGETKPSHTYKHVISTIPLPVLRTLDIDDPALFTIQQRNAMRQLSYGPSVKIGIKFKSQWWHDYKDLNIVGGQSSTDRVIRTTVYPSYGVEGPNKSTVLIASYTWTSDAASIGALVNSGPEAESRLKAVVLRDLAQVHGVPFEMLDAEFEEMYPWDWQHHPLSQGAFAFFGPGQFRRLYQSLTHPAAGGYLHMAGEAISPRHAWIVGALDASWRAVLEILWGSGPVGWALVKQFKTLWGENEEWVPSAQFKAPLPQANHLVRGAGMEAKVRKVAKVAKGEEAENEEAEEAEEAEAEVEEAKEGEMEETKEGEVEESMPEPDLLVYQLLAHGISF